MLANRIRANGMRWLCLQENSAEEIVELIFLEQFILVLWLQARNWVLCQEPDLLEEAVRFMEVFTSAGQGAYPALGEGREGHRDQGTTDRDGPAGDPEEERQWPSRQRIRHDRETPCTENQLHSPSIQVSGPDATPKKAQGDRGEPGRRRLFPV